MIKIYSVHFKGDSINRKGERGPCHMKGSISHQIWVKPCLWVFFPPLLPSTSTFFKFSSYNRALYTINPSHTPTAASSVWSRDTGHLSSERGALGNSKPSMGAPHWAWQLSMLLLEIAEYSQIAEQQSERKRSKETGMGMRCQCVCKCVSPCPTACFSSKCSCAWTYMCSAVSLGTKLSWDKEG